MVMCQSGRPLAWPRANVPGRKQVKWSIFGLKAWNFIQTVFSIYFKIMSGDTHIMSGGVKFTGAVIKLLDSNLAFSRGQHNDNDGIIA